jgi:hypothetical protein
MEKDEGMTKHEVLFARQSASFAVITSRLRECGRIARMFVIPSVVEESLTSLA